jgi:DNA repair exonuclease SbcCD ATPase subunit
MLGDLFETTGFVDTLSLSVATKACADLTDVCAKVHAQLLFVVGNHDMYNCNYHNLEFLALGTDIQVIEKPTVLKLGSDKQGGDQYTFYVYPYTEDPSFELSQGPGVVLSHVNVVGGMFNSKKASTVGVNPLSVAGSICFNGHHHQYQRVSNNFINVGSLLSRSFKDVGSPDKGALVVDVSPKGELISLHRLVNPHEIPYVDVDLTSAAAVITWREKADQLQLDEIEGKYVRLKSSPDAVDVASLIESVSLGCRSDVVKERVTDQQIVSASDKFSPEDNFARFVDDVMLFDEQGQRAEYLSAGLVYIQQVKAEQHYTTKPVSFQDVTIQNFQAVREAYLDLATPGVVLIKGENGAGKSTLSEAVYWLVTGKSLRGNTGDEVIHWNERKCEVTCNIVIGGEHYRVTRTKDRGKPQRVKLEKQNHYQDYVDISARKVKDTADLIQKLLGRSNEILEQSVFLISDLKTKFTSLSYPDRVNLLEDITNSKVYRAVFDAVKKDVVKLERDMHILAGSKESTERYYETTKEKLKRANGELVSFTRDSAARSEHIKKQLATTKDLLASAQSDFDSLEMDVQDTDYPMFTKINELDLERVRIESRIDLLKREITQESTRVVRIKDLVSKGVCPTCYSEITAEHLPESLKNEVEEAKKAVIECKRDVKSLLLELQNIDASISDARIERAKKEKQRSLKAQEKAQASKRVATLKQDLLSLQSELLSCTDATVLKTVAKNLKEQVIEYKQNLSDCEQALDQAKVDLVRLTWLQDAFSTRGLRASVLSNFTVPFLNSKLAEYSGIFGLPCSLVTEVETKAGDIQSKIDVVPHDERTYRSCSRGEKRRIDLAMQCALSDLAAATAGASVNLLVGDEIIDPLDRRGVEMFLDILKSKDAATILLTTHNVYADTFADRSISVINENKCAKVTNAL